MIRPHPQRIFPLSQPGALLKQMVAKPATRKAETDSDPDYLKMVRQCPCLKCGLDPCGVAAHLRMNSGLYNKRQALGKKPSSAWVTPLCAGCHTNDPDAQHRIGEQTFWAAIGVNPFLTCQNLYAQRGDLAAMRAVIFSTIAQRGR